MIFEGKKILIIGDVMLDKYTFGEVERISPEAPIPVVSVKRETYVPGGAANTANNVAALGGHAVLIGLTGKDQAHDLLAEEARKRRIDVNGVIESDKRRTIQKIRIIAQNQQLLRIDWDDENYIDRETTQILLEKIEAQGKADAIVISDYAKGLVTAELMDAVRDICKIQKIPLIVDPKPQHRDWYHGASVITPNKKEAEGMMGMKLANDREVEAAGNELARTLRSNVLITMGERGMTLFESSSASFHIPTVAKEVYDVSGAGDTVVAVLSLALAIGRPLREAALLANQAAGIKVAKFGTAPVHYDELKPYLKN